jgi:hypothetical protein
MGKNIPESFKTDCSRPFKGKQKSDVFLKTPGKRYFTRKHHSGIGILPWSTSKKSTRYYPCNNTEEVKRAKKAEISQGLDLNSCLISLIFSGEEKRS